MSTKVYLVTSPRHGYKRTPLELCEKHRDEWATARKDNKVEPATDKRDLENEDGEHCETCACINDYD